MRGRASREIQAAGRGRFHEVERRRALARVTARIFIWTLVLVTPLATAVAKGKPGGGGSEDLGIPGIDLGLPEGCSNSADAWAVGIEDDGISASTVSVAGAIQGCESGSPPQPYVWNGGEWQAIDLLPGEPGGIADDVTATGIAVGSFTGGGVSTAFVRQSEGVVQALPKGGFFHSDAYDVSNNGLFIAGHLNVEDVEENFSQAAVWAWDETDWSLTLLGEGTALGVSENGRLVLGALYGTEPEDSWEVVWRDGAPEQLGPMSAARAAAIAPGGDLVVGFRWESCSGGKRNRECWYEVPVYWVWDEQSGGWVQSDLEALDGVDSEARGVAHVVGKGLVIVGYGYTRADSVMRAVAWVPNADGSYGAPIRLAPSDGNSGSWAWANDVSSSGLVTGASEVAGRRGRKYRRAVVWALP